MRTTGATLPLLGLVVVSLTAADAARADGPGLYMWGAGPKLGMIVLPGRYPYALPAKIANYDFRDTGPRAGDPNGDEPERDLSAGGTPMYTTLAPVGFDLRLGGEGFLALDAQNRFGAGLGLGLGSRYSDYWFTVNYDRVLLSKSPIDVVAGLQVGYGGVGWRGNAEEGGDLERLKMSYYPVRARIEAQYRDKTRMYGLGLFVQDSIPARTTYTDLEGEVQEAVGGPGNFALFFAGGVEIDVQFGDFTPPKKKKKGGKKGGAGAGAGAKKGGGGGGGGGAKGGGKKGGGGGGSKPPQHP